MKKFTFKGLFAILLLVVFSANSSAQAVTATPANIMKPLAGNTVSVFIDRTGTWAAGTYVWTVDNPTGVTIGAFSQTGGAAGDVTVTFSSAANGVYTFTLTRGATVRSVTITLNNILASVANDSTTGNRGQWAGGFLANLGVLAGNANGQKNMFDFGLTERVSAVAINQAGFIYYIENIDNNNGSVTVRARTSTGTGGGIIGTLDLNAGGGNDLGFVRLGVDVTGVCWILAGDGTTIYLARFTTNGTTAAPITLVSSNVPFGPNSGDASLFQNGDLAFIANGTMFILANDGAASPTSTAIFTLNPTAVTPTLNRKFFVLDNLGAAFVGTVNGAAFDLQGNLYISAADGLYFIDQNSVIGNSTVQADLVHSVVGLTDLGSNVWPTQSTLPVDLISFAGAYSNQKTNLNWVTENLQDFDRFEVERSSDGSNFATVATKAPVPTAARTTYLHTDDLSAVNGTVFYYRLKMIDLNGQFKYSNVILVRKESNVKGIRINPNPVVTGGVATLRFEASAKGVVEFRIVDMAGRIVLKQQNNVAEGINSVPVNSLDRLQPGTYILQMNDGTTIQSTKFIVAQ